MAFKLPVLTTEVDCAAIDYPGLTVTFRLNPPTVKYEPPWAGVEDQKKRREMQAAEPWASEYYFALARQIERVTVPGALTDSGAPEVVEIRDGRDLWDLEHRPDFDMQILLWAARQYARLRNERLAAEVKNSPAASGGPDGPSARE